MISVAMLGGGRAAATYYLERQADCAAAYYEGDRELPGRWIGHGAAALDLTGELGAAGGHTFAQLLDGTLPNCRRAVRPVWRSDPRGQVDARPLLAAIEREAARRGCPAAELFADERDTAMHARLAARAASQSRRGRGVEVSATTVAELARAAGLDPAHIYPGHGRGAYASALRRVDAKVDVRRAGLDVVMSPPKSVSTLFALAEPATADAVRQAHERAVDEAVGYLERAAGHGLRGHQGDGRRADRVPTDGFVAAAFTHQTSRCDDPQLHTHVVVVNLVRGVDGRFSSVDSRAVHKHAMTAGYLYQAVLRGELTRRLGVAWAPVERGVAEIADVPATLLAAFSQRRTAIEEALERTRGRSRAAAQAACYATRPAKSHVPVWRLREDWRRRATALDVDPDALVASVRDRMRTPAAPTEAALEVELFGPSGLTRHQTTFDRRDVLQALATSIPLGLPVSALALEKLASRLTASSEAVPVIAASDPVTGRRFTAANLLATEQRALSLAAQQTKLAPIAQSFDAVGLSTQQRDIAEGLVSSSRLVDLVVGPAGTGKTVAVSAAVRAWQVRGVPVHGVALAAVAARRLECAAGIPSMSLARFLATAPVGDAPAVVVVDEAGMVGTRQLAALFDRVHAVGGKVVLVGDPAQLPEVEAGGLFATLVRDRVTAEPASNRRQAAAWEHAALLQLRDGHVARAVAAYAEHGRMHTAAGPAELVSQVATHYVDARQRSTDPYGVAVLAGRRDEVAALNSAARQAARAAGLLHGPDHRVGRLELAVGDVVLVGRNDLRRDLLNGTRAQVRDIRDGAVSLITEDGRSLAVPAEWAADRLTHAYAMTVHKAQGLTVDEALLYGAGAITRQAAYVGLSRGRASNQLFLTVPELHPARAVAAGDGQVPLFEPMRPDPRSGPAFVDEVAAHVSEAVGHRLAIEQVTRRRPRVQAPPYEHPGRDRCRGLDR